MFLVKQKNNSWYPAFQSDEEENAKYKVGAEVRVVKTRNIKFHNKFFALLKLLFDNQDETNNEETHRKLMIINCGYFDYAKRSDGVMIQIAHSISFENMKAEDFEKLYSKLLDVAVIKLQSNPEEIQNELKNYM